MKKSLSRCIRSITSGFHHDFHNISSIRCFSSSFPTSSILLSNSYIYNAVNPFINKNGRNNAVMFFSTNSKEYQSIQSNNTNEIISVFTNPKSKRMDICKAGEQIIQEQIHLSEIQLKEVVNRLYLSRFYNLIRRLTIQHIHDNTKFHSGLSKTLIRVASVLNDKSFFILISKHILPSLIQPCGELAGVYVRAILKLYGYDEGMQYFNQCSSQDQRYRVIIPEFLFGLYENQYYEECISLFNILASDYGWEAFPDTKETDYQSYMDRQKYLKILHHSRIYAAVIGSHLACNDYDLAYSFYKEMNFWGFTPLRETYYDFITYGDHSEEYKKDIQNLPSSLTDVQKSYLTSLAKCKQYDKILPFVEQHNQYRFTREPQEHPIEQTYEVSVRLTPPSYQRMEVYRILKEMKKKDRKIWFTGRIIVKVNQDCHGIIQLLTQDIQPAIDYHLHDYDEIHIDCSSVYSWLDIHDMLVKDLQSVHLVK